MVWYSALFYFNNSYKEREAVLRVTAASYPSCGMTQVPNCHHISYALSVAIGGRDVMESRFESDEKLLRRVVALREREKKEKELAEQREKERQARIERELAEQREKERREMEKRERELAKQREKELKERREKEEERKRTEYSAKLRREYNQLLNSYNLSESHFSCVKGWAHLFLYSTMYGDCYEICFYIPDGHLEWTPSMPKGVAEELISLRVRININEWKPRK